MGQVKVTDLPPSVDRTTAADLASHDVAPPGDRPVLHRVAPSFVRVLRNDPARPEVLHTPGEAIGAEVAAILDAGAATAGADGVLTVDLT
jgi:hypothetical protein